MANATVNKKSSAQATDDAANFEQFQATPYYQGLGIDKLQQQLAGYQTDDATLRTQAENQYKPTYDAELESLRQQLAQQVQGYNSQIVGLDASYDRQKRQTNEAYNESANTLNNTLTKRGLGRSSLVSTQGAHLEKQRNQALGEIDANQASAINSLHDKIALLNDQAAQSEKTLSGNYAAQIEARINELRRENQSAATNLQLQIASLQQQGYQAYQNWLLANREMELAEKEFEYTKSKNRSSSTSSGQGASNSVGANTTTSDDLLGKLVGQGNTSSKNAAANISALTNLLKKTGSAVGNVTSTFGSKIANLFK